MDDFPFCTRRTLSNVSSNKSSRRRLSTPPPTAWATSSPK